MTKAKSYFITGDPEEIDNLESSTLSVSGAFYDGSNTFGSSGQILSSDGTKTVWINASGATVGSATSVGTNLDSTNASRFVTFVETTSGNNIIRVDSDLTYNPSTNTLTAGSFSGSGANLTAINASNLGSGTIPDARFPATLPAVSGANLTGIAAFSAGTLMLFQQTSAPTGWTKQTTHNDKALRVVSGSASSGGSTAFTSVFTSRTPSGSVSGSNSGGSVSSHTLSTSEIPSHTHTHLRKGAAGNNVTGGPSPINDGLLTDNTGATGSGGAHSHGFTNPSWSGTFSGSALDFAVQYVDLIIASKN